MATNDTPQAMAESLAGSIPVNFQKAFTQVIRAGNRVMFSKETHGLLLDALLADGPVAENIGNGMASLMGMLLKKSNGTMPGEVVIPAGIYLIMQGADFLEQATGEKMTPQILADAVQAFISAMVKAIGGDPAQLEAAAGDLAQQRQAAEQGGQQPTGGV